MTLEIEFAAAAPVVSLPVRAAIHVRAPGSEDSREMAKEHRRCRFGRGRAVARPEHRLGRRFRRRRRELARLNFRLESDAVMAPVAERLVVGIAAAAERNRVAAGKIELAFLGVLDHEVARDSQRSVVQAYDCSATHSGSPSLESWAGGRPLTEDSLEYNSALHKPKNPSRGNADTVAKFTSQKHGLRHRLW